MKKEDYKIHIIGAGISGLIAAQVLENHGYHPVILEKSDRIGGRVTSDQFDNHTLDRGFQVLLTAYPLAKKYLDYKALDLHHFLPGAALFNTKNIQKIGDPLRSFSLLIPTLLSDAATFSDKLKIFKLSRALKTKSIEEIFEEEEQTTLAFLQSYGFSSTVIDNFFKPFFTGIFLEPDLRTSSRMFQFVYKMFSEGSAAIPKRGIKAIPEQLYNNLKHTTIQYSTDVQQVKEGKIILTDDTTIDSHFTIIATTPSSLIQNLNNQETVWKSCDTLYFVTATAVLSDDLIGLVTEEESLINNINYLPQVQTSGDDHVLCVTVVKKHQLTEEELITKVQEELAAYCGIVRTKFIKRYRISQALPDITNVHYSMSPTETNILPRVYLAGDHLLNSSLNGAMLSGELAAMGVVNALEDGLVVGELTSEYR
ncbi:NAD(P)/FAD-dependent oxidoreductase [Aquimarina brevivitae]|uniref:Flavin-dependent amine oxidoreductase n=1 Tax=Aquimarina brevivitae TaxID=323412 RepID=A0A4Q7P1Y8_9FLAO|nr:NAD(P)/FAD-dependent oxidoreductase [Aquimarina brevivitae]RZS93881.1 flavin-dependent amine oxidoreductase [Aquimarina brevivitae]